jgi:hypothetical protein
MTSQPTLFLRLNTADVTGERSQLTSSPLNQNKREKKESRQILVGKLWKDKNEVSLSEMASLPGVTKEVGVFSEGTAVHLSLKVLNRCQGFFHKHEPGLLQNSTRVLFVSRFTLLIIVANVGRNPQKREKCFL